jgi:hypothetical protein
LPSQQTHHQIFHQLVVVAVVLMLLVVLEDLVAVEEVGQVSVMLAVLEIFLQLLHHKVMLAEVEALHMMEVVEEAEEQVLQEIMQQLLQKPQETAA